MLRPQGMPLEVGGPPARGRVALPRDRKVCHWKSAGRPQGIPFFSGLVETTGTTETAGKWQAMLPRLAIGPREGNACAPSHRPVRSPRAYSWREAPPRHNPGGPGGPGSRRQSREAAWRLPRPPARPPQLAIGNIGNWQHLHIGNIPHHAPLRATPGKSAVLANRSRP